MTSSNGTATTAGASIAQNLRIGLSSPKWLSGDERRCGEALTEALTLLRAPAQLVEIYGSNQNWAKRYFLPVRRYVHDHEAVLKHSGNQHADHGSSDRSDSTEETGATEHDRCDRRQV